MAVGNRISGMDTVLRNLNREVQKIKGRTVGGMREAALIVRRRAQQLTPIDTGHLRENVWTDAWNTPKGPVAGIHFGAAYAVVVHEVQASHQVGQWKFLEAALKEKTPEILRVLGQTAMGRILGRR